MLPERLGLRWVDELVSGEHKNGGERGDRNRFQYRRRCHHQHQNPHAVQDGTRARSGSRLNIGRRAHDDARHRQRTKNTADGIADTLGNQLTVVIGARSIMSLVDRSCAQERFCTGDDGDGNSGLQHRRIQCGAEALHGGELQSRKQVVRDVDELHAEGHGMRRRHTRDHSNEWRWHQS